MFPQERHKQVREQIRGFNYRCCCSIGRARTMSRSVDEQNIMPFRQGEGGNREARQVKIAAVAPAAMDAHQQWCVHQAASEQASGKPPVPAVDFSCQC